MTGINFYALNDQRDAMVYLDTHGQVQIKGRNLLVFPQSVTEYLNTQAQSLWFPAAVGPKRQNPAWIVNNCTDPVTYRSGLEWLAQHFGTGVPIFNAPEGVHASARDNQTALFGGIEGLDVPNVKALRFGSEEELRACFEEGGFSFPVLVRPATYQTGIGLQRVDSHDDWGKLLYTRWHNQPHYMIQYVDTKTAKDAYLKLRVQFIGKRPFLRHIKASPDWHVRNDSNAPIAGFPDAEMEMINALSENAALMAIFEEMGARMPLDFWGADIGIDPDRGTCVLFEANPSMSMYFPDRPARDAADKARREQLQVAPAEHLLALISDPSAWWHQG